jgi:hypothetical protein
MQRVTLQESTSTNVCSTENLPSRNVQEREWRTRPQRLQASVLFVAGLKSDRNQRCACRWYIRMGKHFGGNEASLYLPVSMNAMKRPVKHDEMAAHQLKLLMFKMPALKNKKSRRSNLCAGKFQHIKASKAEKDSRTVTETNHRMQQRTGRWQRQQAEGGGGPLERYQRVLESHPLQPFPCLRSGMQAQLRIQQ